MNVDFDFLALFEYRALTKIHGEPDYTSLKLLKEQLKANAAKIISDLGGGQHGHLGLVLTPLEYANASAVPYVRPPHPGPLVIPGGSTARQENTIREDHKKATKLYRETVNLERTLKSLILDAIDSDYLDELLSCTTTTLPPKTARAFWRSFRKGAGPSS